MDWLDSFSQEVQETPQVETGILSTVPVQSETQEVPVAPAEDWLSTFETQVQETQEVPEVSKGKTFEDWFGEKYEGTKEFLEATGESAVQLGYGAVSFLPSYGLGFATTLNEKLKNLLRQDRIEETVRRGGFPVSPQATDLARKPMAQRLEEAKIKTPKEIRALAEESAGFFADVMEEPITPGGKKVVGKAGELMDWLFHYPHEADKKLSKAGYPNLGYLTGFAGEMLLLKGLHGAAKKGKKVSEATISRFIKTVEDVKKIETPTDLKAVSRQVDKILDQLGITEEQRMIATDNTFRAQRDVGSWVEERARILQEKEVPSAKEITREVKEAGIEERIERPTKEEIRLRDVKKDRLAAPKERGVVVEAEVKVPVEKPSVRKLNIEKVKDTKLVDSEGQPKEVYHNTNREFEEFDNKMMGTATDAGYYGKGFYFSTVPSSSYGKNTVSAYLDIKKPLREVNRIFEEIANELYPKVKDLSSKQIDMIESKMTDRAKAQGYDGIIAGPESVVFDASQIHINKIDRPKPSIQELSVEEQFGKRVAGEISDGVKIAEDMGVFETIRAGVEGKKKVGEIMKDVKESRYYEEDLKDFGYNEKDLRNAIKAVKVQEFADTKIAEGLKAKLEKEVVPPKKIAEPKPKPEVPRVDVERGRPPGIKAEPVKVKPPRVKEELMELQIRREAEMAPLRTAEGKLVGSKVLAQRLAKSRGLLGDIVRTPDGKGWYVKKTKEMKKAEVEATKKLWDDVLKEEGLGVLDIVKGERGAITVSPEAITKLKETLKPKWDKNAQSWKYEVKGMLQEIYKDPESNMWYDAQRLTPGSKTRPLYLGDTKAEAVMKTVDLTMESLKTLGIVDILKSERGSVTIEPETIKKLQDSVKRRKVSEADLIAEMQRRKVPDSQILKAFPNAFKKTAVEGTSKFLKKGQDPEKFLPRRVLKKGKAGKPGRLAPAVTRGDAHVVATHMKDLPRPIFGEKVRTLATSEGLFTQLGKPLKNTFYYAMRAAAKAENDFVTNTVKASNKVKQTFPIGTRQKAGDRIGMHSIAKQKDGLARLKNQGIKEKDIPKKLTKKEAEALEFQETLYKAFHREINKARVASGQQPFPAVENYSPWLHDLAKLQEFEKINILDDLGKINQAMARLREIPSQIEKVSRAPGMAGHEKFRAGPETPGYLHLNAFDNFNAYAKLAGRAIHIGPTTAYLHELLLPRYKLAENAPNTWRFISDWLDYQKGHEPIMYVTNPVTRRRMGSLSSNVAVSYVTYNWGSMLNQASSINNTIALIGLPRTIEGFVRTMSPAEHMRAAKTSDVLTVRSPEVALMEAGRPYPWIPGKIGRSVSDLGKKIKTFGSAPLMFSDSLIAKASWFGSEAKAKRIYKTSKTYKEMPEVKRAKAMKDFIKHYADDVVEQAQGSATRAARAPFQRTAEGAAMSTLQTFVIANFDFLSRQVLGIKNPDITNLQRVARLTNYIAATAAIAYTFDFMGMRSPVPDPVKAAREEAEKLGYVTDIERYTKVSKAIGKEMLEYVPIYGGKFKYGSEFGGALVNELVKLGNGDATAIPRLLGIPGFQQFLKSYRAAERGGTNIDVIFGRYIERPKKISRYRKR